MTTKLFVLGRPGTGKSTVAKHIKSLMREPSIHFNDYDVLYKMFRADTKQERFLPTPNNGFDVTDFSVVDEALHEMEQEAKPFLLSHKLVSLEFARDNYRHALRQFSPDFLRDAHFLFLNASVETCLSRIHQRVSNRTATDDHPSLSDAKFRIYYGGDYSKYVLSDLRKDFQVTDDRFAFIDNEGDRDTFLTKIDLYYEEKLLPSLGKETQSALPLGIPSNGENTLTIQQIGLPPERR